MSPRAEGESRHFSPPRPPVRLKGKIRALARLDLTGWLGVLALAVIAMWLAVMVGATRREARSLSSLTAPAIFDKAPEDPIAFTLAPSSLRELTVVDARRLNASLPVSTAAIRPMTGFPTPIYGAETRSRALDCLTAAVYYEAASESRLGQAAVAQVVLNRVRHPAYPHSVCGVVFQGAERRTGCQFSFTCDGAMTRAPSVGGWARAKGIAEAALNGAVVAEVGTATHFHTDQVAPYWAPRLSKIVRIGAHIFYRWNGAWGLPSAFDARYAGSEPALFGRLDAAAFVAEPAEETLAEAGGPTMTHAPEWSPPLPVKEIVATDIDAATSGPVLPIEIAGPDAIATPVARREIDVMADPLASPTAPPVRRRPRIAAPSAW